MRCDSHTSSAQRENNCSFASGTSQASSLAVKKKEINNKPLCTSCTSSSPREVKILDLISGYSLILKFHIVMFNYSSSKTSVAINI